VKKRIVLCFDGTWNTPSEKVVGMQDMHDRLASLAGDSAAALEAAVEHVNPDAGIETNVCRFYRSVLRQEGSRDGGELAQVKWYDNGVGTDWYDRVRGGVFGLGLSRKIREGYHFLSQTYAADDEVFVFGFSRGAYTARSLVGMVRNCGLLPASLTADGPDGDALLEAYELYRTRSDGADSERARAFRARKNAPIIRIKCVGVWDTVGALGIPIESFDEFNKEFFEFHDTELSGTVENAFHALAVDEHREPSAATLWDPKEKPNQTVEQRWFIGAHADVGGGYEERRLSDMTLRWMQEKAQECGLKLDPRGIPAVGPDNASAPVTDSFAAFLGGIFRLFHSRYYRPIGRAKFGEEVIDATVHARIVADVGYRPKNDGIG
jgi:uncharacterized protein (DUF2235 family)